MEDLTKKQELKSSLTVDNSFNNLKKIVTEHPLTMIILTSLVVTSFAGCSSPAPNVKRTSEVDNIRKAEIKNNPVTNTPETYQKISTDALALSKSITESLDFLDNKETAYLERYGIYYNISNENEQKNTLKTVEKINSQINDLTILLLSLSQNAELSTNFTIILASASNELGDGNRNLKEIPSGGTVPFSAIEDSNGLVNILELLAVEANKEAEKLKLKQNTNTNQSKN